MDPQFEKIYSKLQKIREREDLSIKPEVLPNLNWSFTDTFGEERDLRLRYYQVQGILHLACMDRFLLGDDTGLGKTLMTICALCSKWRTNPNQKAIVLTPKSAVTQWCDEIERFTDGVSVFPVTGSPSSRKRKDGTRQTVKEYRNEIYLRFLKAKGPCVLVMGYEKARLDFRTFQRWRKYILICDEATKFKNPDTHIYQVIRHFSKMAKTVWCLTATLIKNNLIEGYAIMECMFPGLFGVKSQFMKRYTITRMIKPGGGGKGKGGYKIPIVVGYKQSHIDAFKKRIDPFYLGRAKFEVASELPMLTTRRVLCGLNHQQKNKYNQALTGMIKLDRERYDEEGKLITHLQTTKLTSLMRCQQIVDHPELIDCDGGSEKLDALVEMLEDEFAGEKVIVFTKLSQMVDIMMPVLKNKKFNPVRITGGETEKQRKKAMASFQSPKSKTKVVCITTAASDAINLQAAKAIIFYDLPWSGGDYLQILGRMIRIGSKHDRVFAVHLLAEKTVDMHVESILQKKMKLIEAVLGTRIKGEKEAANTVIKQENEISDIFDLVAEDARAL